MKHRNETEDDEEYFKEYKCKQHEVHHSKHRCTKSVKRFVVISFLWLVLVLKSKANKIEFRFQTKYESQTQCLHWELVLYSQTEQSWTWVWTYGDRLRWGLWKQELSSAFMESFGYIWTERKPPNTNGSGLNQNNKLISVPSFPTCKFPVNSVNKI